MNWISVSPLSPLGLFLFMIPRIVTFEIRNYLCRAMKGIYRISLGDRFYIGSTFSIYKRTYQHEFSLNKTIFNYPTSHPRYDNYNKWAQYVFESRGVEKAYVDVVERCISDEQMWHRELYHIREVYGNPNNLNQSPNVARPSSMLGGEEHLWDVKKCNKGNMLVYFDVNNPDNYIGCLELLNKNGTVQKKGRKSPNVSCNKSESLP
jgi:hypothetical protein